jgi:hypothetical protein
MFAAGAGVRDLRRAAPNSAKHDHQHVVAQAAFGQVVNQCADILIEHRQHVAIRLEDLRLAPL